MKILFVDDERDVKDLYTQRFRKEIKEGILQPFFAFSGTEAIALMSELDPMDIILLLSDINMPDMSGFELFSIVKDKFPYLHVWMVSAYGDQANMEKAIHMGAEQFFTKPIDFDLMRNKLFNSGI
ncbi:MAG TPA: response regulator [Saprospiraceae bacterium]|nr:response regulator [Saprospiraceae bacterium]